MRQANTGWDDSEFNLAALVRPIQRRLALRNFAHQALIGGALALAAAAMVQAYARMLTWPDRDPLGGPGHWTVAIVAVCAVAVCIWTWYAWPPMSAVIRYTDRALGFQDRLSTAYEFRGQESAFLRLLRIDLTARRQEIDARRAAPLHLSWRDLTVTASMVLLLLCAMALPNKQASAEQQHTQDRSAALHAAQTLARVGKSLLPRTSPHARTASTLSPAEKQAEQALRTAEAALAGAKNKAEALKALSRARQQLQQLQAQSQSASAQLQRLAQSLMNSPTAPLARAVSSGQASALQQAVQSLAASAPKLTAQQRASLVQSLERAANDSGSSMSQSLREAASAAANNDSSTLSQALQSLSNTVQRAEDRAAAQHASARV